MTTLPEWANWLARDEDGSLFVSEGKPYKVGNHWEVSNSLNDGIYETETDDTFSHIKWEDNNPTSVSEAELRIATEEDTRAMKNIGMTFDEAMKRTTELPTAETIQKTKQAAAHGYAETPIIKPIDPVNHPNHYKGRHGLEAIEIVRNFGNDDMVAGFYWGNAIKYMTRYRNKNGLEDLKKARKNLDWLIEHEEGEREAE